VRVHVAFTPDEEASALASGSERVLCCAEIEDGAAEIVA